MYFEDLLEIVGSEPVFESSMLYAGEQNPSAVRLQLSRWTASGRLLQLRRGLYTLAPLYQKKRPHPFLVANRLRSASYVSCQSALDYYGLIPDVVQMTISVTTRRPYEFINPLGKFSFRHINQSLFFGYHLVDLDADQRAFIALPEKALLDLVYLEPDGDSEEYLQELRLQNLSLLDLNLLQKLIQRINKPKLFRAEKNIVQLVESELIYEEI
jgi:predicted transcriptional regulator of viral defense system